MSNGRTIRRGKTKSKSRTKSTPSSKSTPEQSSSNNDDSLNRTNKDPTKSNEDDDATMIHYACFILSLVVLGYAIYCSKYQKNHHTNNSSSTTTMKMDSLSSPFSAMVQQLQMELSTKMLTESRKMEQERTIWQQQQQQTQPEFECSVFVAPSTVAGGGWGMFAGKKFQKDEVVEIAPFYVPLPPQSSVIYNSVLKDYIYAYYHRKLKVPPSTPGAAAAASSGHLQQTIPLASVSLGYIMVANHNSKPNIKSYFYGQEPPPSSVKFDPQHSSSPKGRTAASHGFVSTRSIQAGEELFSSYSADGGQNWFLERGLIMNTPMTTIYTDQTSGNNDDDNDDNASIIPDLDSAKQMYCPKLYGGIGQSTLIKRMMTKPKATPTTAKEKNNDPYHKEKLFPPFDAGWGNVIARQDLNHGDVIESVPALLFTRSQTNKTALAPLLIGWDDLSRTHRTVLRHLRQDGELFTQYQDSQTTRKDNWEGFENIAILPLGSIGIVRRRIRKQVGQESDDNISNNDQNNDDSLSSSSSSSLSEDSNCHLVIQSSSKKDSTRKMSSPRSNTENGNAGIVLDLVATQSIKAGEILKVDLPMSGTQEERLLLLQHIQQTGQPLPPIEFFQDILASPTTAPPIF